jgi:hypothetical protein
MEKEKPILIKYGLVFGGNLSIDDYAKADNLIKNANFDFVLNLNSQKIDFNYKNLIIAYDYKNQNIEKLPIKNNTFSICRLYDDQTELKDDLVAYDFKRSPSLCVLIGNRFSPYLEENIFYFSKNDVQYIIANQNSKINDFQYIILKISYFPYETRFECWHNYGWLLDYYRKNE